MERHEIEAVFDQKCASGYDQQSERVDAPVRAEFVFPFLAHALGTLAGALVAFLVAASHRPVFASVIGAFFLAGGIAVSPDSRAGVVRHP